MTDYNWYNINTFESPSLPALNLIYSLLYTGAELLVIKKCCNRCRRAIMAVWDQLRNFYLCNWRSIIFKILGEPDCLTHHDAADAATIIRHKHFTLELKKGHSFPPQIYLCWTKLNIWVEQVASEKPAADVDIISFTSSG